MKTLIIFVGATIVAFFVMAGVYQLGAMNATRVSEPTPQSIATIVPTNTPMPTDTPIPTVALPTLTPSPTVDSDTAFLNWLAANGFEFVSYMDNGGENYQRPAPNDGVWVQITPDHILAWAIGVHDAEVPITIYETSVIVISAIEIYGLDAEPVRSALASPYQFPLILQFPGYLFQFKREPFDPFTNISASVTLFDTK